MPFRIPANLSYRAMLRSRVALRIAILAISGFFLGVGDAHAYIDPNVGGWLYQILFPVLVALGGAWAVFRQRFSGLFSALVRWLLGK